ncbi:sulfurtransferase TusA family protein [Colwellia ponticola]|uniref:Sulfurtransferase TusA family protein n=1 Tax=Colwellia ponticola TaxID=2304625 RepID=A0A8H2PLI0_9GAMM|nr:sulfurtransferase TusA family protein [Colwellia ponticola]TMM44773.1 sulfurtransferase TusA family protein [Colwellia ponticola]
MIYKYDGKGQKCPVPLVNLRFLLKKMHQGDQCIILIDDIGSINDIPKLLDKYNYCYQAQTIDDGAVEIQIEAPSAKTNAKVNAKF